MKFSLSKESLSHLLYLTSSVVERRNTMPIMANVKLTAADGKLSVAATDLEISLLGEVEAEVEQSGSITAGAKVLYDIVRELPEETVRIVLSDGQRLMVESGNAKFKINGTSSDEFPSIVGTDLPRPISIDASKFYDMLDKTAFAVSTDETRYNINGVYVSTVAEKTGGDASTLRLVATDGHRLALIDRPAEGFSLDKGVIIPRKGIQELKKVLEGNDGAALVSTNDGFFTVQSGSVTIGIRLVDGQFPDYKQVIPKENSTTVDIERSELLAALKRVSLVTTDKSRAVKLALTGNALMVSSSSPEHGEASETVSVSAEGADVTIGFSARYLIDLLSAMSSTEVVQLKLNGELSPGVFYGTNDEEYRCIVMPMRFE